MGLGAKVKHRTDVTTGHHPHQLGWSLSPGQEAQLTCRFSKWAKDLQWASCASELLWQSLWQMRHTWPTTGTRKSIPVGKRRRRGDRLPGQDAMAGMGHLEAGVRAGVLPYAVLGL